MNISGFSIVATLFGLTACTWRSSPPTPSPCTALSVDLNAAPQFVKADSSPPLTFPYTIIVDDIIVGVVRSRTDTAAKLGSFESETFKKAEIIPASRAKQRWPSAVGDVVHIDRCHEPVRRPTIYRFVVQ
jgi:hypothetical protein